MTDHNHLNHSWLNTAYAKQLLACESPYLRQALKQITGPRVLQIGNVVEQPVIEELDFPQLVITSQCNRAERATVHADPAFLPIQADSIASVILPHSLESHELPHQVLREAHRVLMSDGYLLLTGLNPVSLVGLQRWLMPWATIRGQYYTPKRVIDWLQLLGFEVVGSAMFQYAPLSKSPRVQKIFRFLNPVGDRWLPMLGGGYMITAKKREIGMNLVGRVRFSRAKRNMAGAAPAKLSLKERMNELIRGF